MEAREEPIVVVEGIEVVIERDLVKHKALLERSRSELDAYRRARSGLVARKRHFATLIGGGKYDDDALRRSIVGINVDVRAMEDKVKLSEEAVSLHTRIVDTLTEQLRGQKDDLAKLAAWRRDHEDADRS